MEGNVCYRVGTRSEARPTRLSAIGHGGLAAASGVPHRLGADLIPVGPWAIKDDPNRVVIHTAVATDHLAGRIKPPPGSDGREKQQQRFAALEPLLGDGADASARNVRHVKPDDAARIIFGNRPTEGLDRHANNGAPILATLLTEGWCLAHMIPPQCLAAPT